jgi:hypothetical protein
MLRRPDAGGVFRRNGDREFGVLPKRKGSIGGIFEGGISMEISMFVFVVCKANALVLDELGVDGVGGFLVARIVVVMGVRYRCFVAPVEWVGAHCPGDCELVEVC